MLNLNTNLNSVGISAAKGIDLVTKRDELAATLPRSGGSADQAAGDAAAGESKKAQRGAAELTPAQQRQVRELERTERKVREHEQAHLSAGRELITSGPNYSYTYGPDGRQYVTAGEVGIDTSPESKAEANIDKGRRIQITALAPADPSPQDYRVASVGSQLESQGRTDLVREQQEQAVQQRAETPESAASTVVEPTAGTPQQRILDTYARAAGGSAQAGQVSVFA